VLSRRRGATSTYAVDRAEIESARDEGKVRADERERGEGVEAGPERASNSRCVGRIHSCSEA